MAIVAAVDTSERSSVVLEQAVTLAKRFDETVHVIHVMTRSEAVEAETSSITSDEGIEIEELRTTAAHVASDVLEEQQSGVETKAVGRIGDPANEVVEYATDQDARYIIVSPRHRSPTGKVIFGSVAQSILLDATCPVVSVADKASI